VTAPYRDFAYIYDWVMHGVDYEMWADYVVSCAKRLGVVGTRLLDVACGTGNTAFTMARRGYRVTGIDLSQQMLDVARGKVEQLASGESVRFVQADMRDFSLGERFSVITCLYDSINYLLCIEDVRRAFGCARSHLDSHGLYVFDVNTEWQLSKTGRGSPTLFEREDGLALFWQDEWCQAQKIWRVTLNGFVRNENGFTRFREVHEERAYSIEELEDTLFDVGFSNVQVYDAYTFLPPRHHSSRLHFVCRA